MRSARRLLWPVLAAVGIGAELVGFGLDNPGSWVPDLLTGSVLGACGLVAWERRPRSLIGRLLVATGGLWFLGDVSAAAVHAYRGPLLQATLSFPSGRPRGWLQVVAVVTAYAATPAWDSEAVTIALALWLSAVAVLQERLAVGRERRERTYALRATVALAGLLAGTAVFRLAISTATEISLLVFEAGLAALAIVLVRTLLREPWARPATDFVVELTGTRSGALRDQLARVLGDRTLEIGFPVDGGYVDAAGRVLALPADGPRRTTVIERDGAPVAVLIHDAALLDDPALATALSEAAELAASNARLQAEVRVQIDAVQASRRRLLAAADDERRRLEQRLESTAERRLVALIPQIDNACEDERLERVAQQIEQSLADLRRLAAGLHPRELAAGGLEDALRALAGRSPVPVELVLSLPERVPDEPGRAAYFICSEGLANIAKYAHATRARLSVTASHGRLRVEVSDDGRGGADADTGSGLRGLADRVEVLCGALTVDSAPGAGTRLLAELPLTGPS
jgi:signal transduction histidine kinase